MLDSTSVTGRTKPNESDFVLNREPVGRQHAPPIVDAAIVMRCSGRLEVEPLVGAYCVGPLVRRARRVLSEYEYPARTEGAPHLAQYDRLVGSPDVVQNEQRPRCVERAELLLRLPGKETSARTRPSRHPKQC